MRCDEFERRLQWRLDQRRRPEADPALRLHAASCGACRELMDGQRLLFARLSDALPEISADFSSRTVSRVPLNPAPHVFIPPLRRRNWNRWLMASVALSVAAIFVFTIGRWANQRGEARGVAVARHHARTSSALPGTIAVFQPAQKSPVARSPSAAANAEGEYSQMVRGLISKLPDVPESQKESIDRIAGGFRPLATTLEAAWDTIRRTIPVGRDQRAAEPQASFGNWNNELHIS